MTIPQTPYASVEARPVFWMDFRDLKSTLGLTIQEMTSVIGHNDVIERASTGQSLADRMTPGQRLPFGCVESVTVSSTFHEPCFLTSIDGACRVIRKVDTTCIDRALRADVDYRQLQEYARAAMFKNVVFDDVLNRASDIVHRRVFQRFLFYVNSRINEASKKSLAKGETYTPELAEQAIYLTRTIRYVGRTDQEIKLSIQNSLLPKKIKDDLSFIEPESTVYDELNVRTLHVMLVYKVEASKFNNRKHLLEKTNGMFFALNGAEIIDHPYSASQQNGQNLSLGDGTRFAMNSEIIYHDYPVDARFLNVGGVVFEINQRQDISRPEGYHCNFRTPKASYEQDSLIQEHFLPMSSLTEENGFFRSYEGAALFNNKDQLAKRSQYMADEAKQRKDLLAAQISAQGAVIQAAKDGGVKVATELSSLFKSLGKDADSHLKDRMHEAATKSIRLDTEIGKALSQLNETWTENLKVAKEFSRITADNAKTQASAEEFSKKELLDILKLIPVTLAAVAGIINFMKGSKKK